MNISLLKYIIYIFLYCNLDVQLIIRLIMTTTTAQTAKCDKAPMTKVILNLLILVINAFISKAISDKWVVLIDKSVIVKPGDNHYVICQNKAFFLQSNL